MKKEDLTKFQKLFEAQMRNLVYTHSVLNREFELKRDDLSDLVDLTSVELEQLMRVRLRSREALFVRKINQALERIHRGTFGICEDCDQEIEIKRLEARPTTSKCIQCKEEQEAQESQHADGRRSKSMGEHFSVLIA